MERFVQKNYTALSYPQCRAVWATTTSALYTAAQQTTAWGAPLSPGQSLAIRICQLSALIGRGAARSVTLTF